MRAVIGIISVWGFFVGNCNPVFGQNKFSFSLSAAPYYNYIKTNVVIQLPQYVSGSILTIPVNSLIHQTAQGYSVGVMARYEFSARFSVSTGIRLNQVKFNPASITTNPDVTSSTYPQIIVEANRKRNYQIPLQLNYQSSTNRLSPFFSVGALLNFPYATIYEGVSSTSPNQKIQLYPTIGAGILYRFNDHLSLLAQPTFAYVLPTRSYIAYQYYQVSLQTQLLYKF